MEGIRALGISRKYKKSQLEFPSKPLSFLRVMERRPMSLDSSALNLPFELLMMSMEYLDVSDASKLAPINRDFWQLSRSHKFAVVRLDYSYRSMGLLIDLYTELKERASGDYGGLTKFTSLGVCIRGIRLVTDHREFSGLHQLHPPPWSTEPGLMQPNFYRNIGCYYEFYLEILRLMISDYTALPSLVYFEWADNTKLTTPFITALAHSGIKHLILSHPLVDDDVVIESYIDDTKIWPLEDLRINLRSVHRMISPRNINGTSALCASILYRCAPTIKHLVWGTSDAGRADPQSFGTDPSTMPLFLRLEKLQLDDSVFFADPQTLDALLQAPIRYLVANTANIDCGHDLDAIKTSCFRRRGTIRSMESFVWTNADLRGQHSLDFLRNNFHISKLCIPMPIIPKLMEERLLPLLEMEFKCLTSLDISWDANWSIEGSAISVSALRSIGQIETLEQLQISIYEMEDWMRGWRIGWVPEHDNIREHIFPLKRLKKFSLVRDIYEEPGQGVFHANHSIEETGAFCTRYYPTPPLRNADDINPSEYPDPIFFDITHIHKVTDEAMEYGKFFQNLEWLYIGQLEFKVTVDDPKPNKEDEVTKSITQISRTRDGCVKKRRKIFGNKYNW